MKEAKFGIKQIAITVAVIVIIGFGIMDIENLIPEWITEIWQLFIDQIKNFIS